jgi:hypothetical protein
VTGYSFEIVRRPNDRYSWKFVEDRGDRRRVLARADRDYRDKERAEKAICVIQNAASGADVVDASGATDVFALPARSFEITPYAVPLLIGQPRARRSRANGHRRTSTSGTTPTTGPPPPPPGGAASTEVSPPVPAGGAAKSAAPAKKATSGVAAIGGAAKKASSRRPATRASKTS